MEQVVKTLGVRAYEKGLELVCDLDDVPTRLVGDPLRLRQVLVNLVGNAIKFTPKGAVVGKRGGGSHTPFGRDGRKSRGRRNVAVRRGRHGHRHRPRGSRANLRALHPGRCLDHAAVRRHGLGTDHRPAPGGSDGRADLGRERAGQGQHLPLHGAPGPARGLEEEPGLPAVSREALRDLPVLVVAENPTSGRILVETFRRWSMKPEMADDVPTALAKVHKAASDRRNFRLILADAMLPGIDGFTLAEWLADDAQLAGPVILMLSASERRNQPKRCQDLGALCLEKPISQSALFNVVAEALGIQQQAVKTADSAPAAISAAPARLLRVLLAEDTPANQKLVTYILGKRGHSVEVVQNGQQALEAVGRQDFDVVLMDVQMPVMDGFQATQAIRKLADPKKARLPIIAMTAHALKGDAERCLDGRHGRLHQQAGQGRGTDRVDRTAGGRSRWFTCGWKTAALNAQKPAVH